MDVLTLSYVNLFIAISAAVLLALMLKHEPQHRHIMYWLLAALALLLNSVFGVLHLSLSFPYWLVPALANTCTISIHLLLLAGLRVHCQRSVKLHWLCGTLLLMYMLNISDFAQAALVNRLLLNFPLIIALNLLAILFLVKQQSSAYRNVYRVFILAFAFNIAQLAVRFSLLLLGQDSWAMSVDHPFIHSLGYYGLSTFAMMAFGSCLYVVYRYQQITLQNTAERDALTGVYNRRAMDLKLQSEWQRAQRQNSSCSIIMLDIDHFKRINDSWGHQIGDDAIRHVSHIATTALRAYDSIFRYGGEEFLICLPDATAADALQIANRIRHNVEQTPVPGDTAFSLTISLGVATSDKADDWQQLVQQADNALYQSKHAGRNQTWHFGQLSDCKQ